MPTVLPLGSSTHGRTKTFGKPMTICPMENGSGWTTPEGDWKSKMVDRSDRLFYRVGGGRTTRQYQGLRFY
jgi:hypothetical protein